MDDPERETFNTKPSPNSNLLPEKFKGSKERSSCPPGLTQVYPQVISSCIAHTLVIQAGINMAYSAILLPQLMADDSTFIITKDEASWIASLMAISTPVGALVCGPFMDLLGRKLFSIITTIPIIVSWFLQVFTPNYVISLYIARILAGFGGGLTTVSLVYISEISHASWRPMLLCLNSVFVSLGILVTNVLGVMLPWRTVALCSGCLTIASAVAILVYNQESPHWLLTFKSHSPKAVEQAKTSLQHLYPDKQMFSTEWNRLLAVTEEKRKEKLSAGSSGKGHIVSEFTKRSSILPLVLLAIIFLFQQLSGTYPIIFYAVQVFQSMGGNFGAGLDADSATIILGVIRFGTSLLTAGLSRSFGRRQLLIVSGIGMTISALIAAIYFESNTAFKSVFNKDRPILLNDSSPLYYNKSVSISDPSINSSLTDSLELSNDSNVIGLVCILTFVTMSSIGILIIPWTLIGEILPMSVRGIGGGIIISYAYILMFGIVKVFPFMLDFLHISGCFYFFSITSLLNVFIVYFFLPETLGKSFEEIEKWFNKPEDQR